LNVLLAFLICIISSSSPISSLYFSLIILYPVREAFLISHPHCFSNIQHLGPYKCIGMAVTVLNLVRFGYDISLSMCILLFHRSVGMLFS
jgi:hypothetical protein